ncbi:mitochondrial division protein 1 [Kalaharituber pfeilii]|nr:mitochondrial division protein 1 [Kalaharituber pfeilii]
MTTPPSPTSGGPPPIVTPPASTASETAARAIRQAADHALTAVSGRDVTAFGRTVTATAATLIQPLGDSITATSKNYQHAMTDISKELRRPSIQNRVLNFAQRTPTEIVRGKLSTTEIQHKALTFLPDDLLRNIPDYDSQYSLFQGFQASLPDGSGRRGKKDGQKQIMGTDAAAETSNLEKLSREREDLTHQLEMFSIRKNMASCEIREIDIKIANLNAMRNIVLERLAKFEQEEAQLEHEILDLDNKIEDIQEELDSVHLEEGDSDTPSSDANPGSFMTESVYGKLSNSSLRAPKKHRNKRRISMPILHEHFEPGHKISEIPTHPDSITSLDFDVPFGTMVTAAVDDTVRVWDLSSGRCLGMLEGHRASVKCLQVEDNLVATGSLDATIRLWDLSRAETYRSSGNHINKKKNYNGEDADDEETDDGRPSTKSTSHSGVDQTGLGECAVFSLDSHVDEVTAIYFHGDTLVSGSADKTLRQWDLEKGRCVQTLDVLWAAAQSSLAPGADDAKWRSTGRTPDLKADFVGALQCFDAALACGTADGMVRLWDLRSGQVHRSLVGHTGPVTCLQFDDVHLVTGSLDRSIRIWDLRTGSIYDAYGYDNPITSMQFDTRRIVSAAQEPVVKVYDKADGRHWDCGEKGSREDGKERSIVDTVRIKDGYLVEGRKDGVVGVWAC